jgi:hypothetical protein
VGCIVPKRECAHWYNVDDKSMAKDTSEDVNIRSLRKAVGTWNNDTDLPSMELLYVIKCHNDCLLSCSSTLGLRCLQRCYHVFMSVTFSDFHPILVVIAKS